MDNCFCSDVRGFVPFIGELDVCGFFPSVLSRVSSVEPMRGAALLESTSGENSRLFLISNRIDQIDSQHNAIDSQPTRSKSKDKPTSNRKYITYNNQFTHDGVIYKVNASKSRKRGLYSEMLHKSIEQLNICQKKWSRVFVLFFNLHHQGYEKRDNRHVSKLFKNLKRRLQRNYNLIEFGYLWAREKEKAKSQHYHCVLFLNGNVIRHSSKLLEIIKSAWSALEPDKHHIPTIKNPYYFIDSDSIKADMIYRMSYLCKIKGKGFRDNQIKDYSTSRLKALSK